ncbi:MAG TPA: hypothetical protein VFF78_04960 [Anaerolineaceae bacterium]|nr:hypothetical protein [Anaerolineaceae bacterium]
MNPKRCPFCGNIPDKYCGELDPDRAGEVFCGNPFCPIFGMRSVKVEEWNFRMKGRMRQQPYPQRKRPAHKRLLFADNAIPVITAPFENENTVILVNSSEIIRLLDVARGQIPGVLEEAKRAVIKKLARRGDIGFEEWLERR